MMVAMTHPTANTAVDCQNPLAVGSTMREKAMSSPMKIRRICQINPCRVSVQYGRIDEHHDGTEQVVIIHKSAKNTLIFMRNKGQQQAEVHRQAAELEWKIPPVIVPVVFYVIEKKLFVDLGKCQKNTAGKEQMQTECFGARPQFPCGKGGERDADQHKY